MDCITNVNIPAPIVEKCQGVYTSTDCIIIPEANATLDLPADSTQTEVNDALTAALIYKQQQIEALEATPVPDGSETKVTAGTNVTVTGTGTIATPYIINTTDSRPYKVYTALLTQIGTDAPIATVLENTLGDIVWTRIAIGDYVGVLNSPVPVEKVHFTAASASEGYILSTFVNDTTHIEIIQKNTNPASYGSEDSMTLSPIEIRIYN